MAARPALSRHPSLDRPWAARGQGVVAYPLRKSRSLLGHLSDGGADRSRGRSSRSSKPRAHHGPRISAVHPNSFRALHRVRRNCCFRQTGRFAFGEYIHPRTWHLCRQHHWDDRRFNGVHPAAAARKQRTKAQCPHRCLLYFPCVEYRRRIDAGWRSAALLRVLARNRFLLDHAHSLATCSVCGGHPAFFVLRCRLGFLWPRRADLCRKPWYREIECQGPD